MLRQGFTINKFRRCGSRPSLHLRGNYKLKRTKFHSIVFLIAQISIARFVFVKFSSHPKLLWEIASQYIQSSPILLDI